MQTIELNLSNPQMKNLLNGETIQVKPKQMDNGEPLHFSSRNHNKLLKSFNNDVGCRISLTKAEIKANSNIMGGKFNLKKTVRNGSKKLAGASKKSNKFIRKADNVIQTVDGIVDQGEIIGQLGIPYVSPAYAALDAGTDALATASHNAKKLSNKSNTAVQSGNNMIQARNAEDRERYGEQFKNDVNRTTDQVGASRTAMSNIRGSGNNPYMPKRVLHNSVKGPELSGGSGIRMGGSFRVLGGGVKLQTDDSNIVGPNHNSFNPIKPEALSGRGMSKKCMKCGHNL